MTSLWTLTLVAGQSQAIDWRLANNDLHAVSDTLI